MRGMACRSIIGHLCGVAPARTEHPFDVANHPVTAIGMTQRGVVTQASRWIDDFVATYEIST